MSYKKKTAVCTGTTALTQSLDLGAAFGKVQKLHLLSNTDTTVAVTITDADGFVIATVASADYTTKTEYFIAPVEAKVFDTAGDPSADTEGAVPGIIAASPLSLVAAGLDATETLTVDVFVEV